MAWDISEINPILEKSRAKSIFRSISPKHSRCRGVEMGTYFHVFKYSTFGDISNTDSNNLSYCLWAVWKSLGHEKASNC